MHMSFDMKFLVKVTINRLNLLVVIKKKRKEKRYPFSALIRIKVLQGHYIWYQSKVKTLGPDGLIDVQVCYKLCNLTM